MLLSYAHYGFRNYDTFWNTFKGKIDIFPERVTKYLCNSEKHDIKSEASCSGLRLISFEFEKGQEYNRKDIPTVRQKQKQSREHRELSR